jgi:hypothetical protein
LSKKIDFQPDNRFADANEALKAFIPTAIDWSDRSTFNCDGL